MRGFFVDTEVENVEKMGKIVSTVTVQRGKQIPDALVNLYCISNFIIYVRMTLEICKI